MSFWGELQRRNVFRVAAAYAVVAWLLIQVASIVLPAFGFPAWALQTLLVFVVLGFFVTIALAWIYELTPAGIRRTESIEGSPGAARDSGRRIDFVIIGLLLLAVSFLIVENYIREDSRVLIKSVAVLPFDNLSPDPDDAYFAAGIHESILNSLAKIQDLSVIARTSVMGYSGQGKSIVEIGRELNVESVMEGSVRYAGDRVRIAAQLIDAETGAHLWSEEYDRTVSDIFSIQTDIATQIASALRVELTSAEQEIVEQPPTDSPEAYAIYLQANAGALDSMQLMLDRAIALDPDFALAYATKARWYALRAVDTFAQSAVSAADRAELERLTRENAERALVLDSNNGMAYASLGALHQYYWRWDEALPAFSRAIELSPNDTGIMETFAWLHSYTGRHTEAIKLLSRAAELDPNAWTTHWRLSVGQALAGELPAALGSINQAIRLAPPVPISNLWLAHVNGALGKHDEALEGLRLVEQLLGANRVPLLLADIANAYALDGSDDDARRVFDEFADLAPADRRIGAGNWVKAYLAVHDYDRAFESFETVLQKKRNTEPEEGYLGLLVELYNVYDDPVLETTRFRNIRNQIVAMD